MAIRANITAEVDPISRIEGHLGIKITTGADGKVSGAQAHGNLWRGFENFLLGRAVNDAITFTQRICGVCPVPHGQTSTYAVDAVLGYSRGHITFANTDAADKDASGNNYGVPPKALLIRNLVSVADTMMSTITHFYHLVAPSYVQGPGIPPWTPFFDDTYYAGALQNKDMVAVPAVPVLGTPHTWPVAGGNRDVWDAVIISYVRALRVRRLVFEAGALFAGRMPMTSCFVGGGVTNDHTEPLAARVAKYKTLMQEVAGFVLSEYIPIALVLGALYPNFDNTTNGPTSPFYVTGDCGIGAGLGRFLAWGAYPNLDDSLTSVGGVSGTGPTNFTVSNKAEMYQKFLGMAWGSVTTPDTSLSVPTNLKESIEQSRYGVSSLDTSVIDANGLAYPGNVNRTRPDRGHGYSYIKGPRWDGYSMEVGPFARLVVAGLYPVNGTSLWFSAPGVFKTNAFGAAADYYFTSASPATLDPTKIAPTIVAALVNAGLLNGDGTGAVANWIANLKGGLSTMDRIRARALEAVVLLDKAIGTLGNASPWIDETAILNSTTAATCRSLPIPVGTVQKWGAHEAARGALMHQAKITGGKIVAYQCIVPTTWNGSPTTTLTTQGTQLGAIESACIGAPFDDAGASYDAQDGTGPVHTEGGVEVMRIAQSFDPCIACAIH